MASLLTDLTAEKTVLAPGQSFRVEAVTARPDAVVAIDGVRGAAQYLQAPLTPGDHEIEVFVGAPGDAQERHVLPITVTEDRRLPRLTLERDPYLPMAAALRVDDAVLLRAAPGSLYTWSVGAEIMQTAEPVLLHDFHSFVDHRQPFTIVDVGLQVAGADGTTTEVRRSLTLWSSYQLAKQLGSVQPLVECAGLAYAAPSSTRYDGSLDVHNIEDGPVAFTSRQLEWLTNEVDAVAVPSLPEAFTLTVGPDETATVMTTVERRTAPSDADGFTVHLLGTAADGTPVHASGTFEFAARRYRDKWAGRGLVAFATPSLLDKIAEVARENPPWLDQAKVAAGPLMDERRLWALGVAVRGVDATMAVPENATPAMLTTIRKVRAEGVGIGWSQVVKNFPSKGVELAAHGQDIGAIGDVVAKHLEVNELGAMGRAATRLITAKEFGAIEWATKFAPLDLGLLDVVNQPVENMPCDPDDLPDEVAENFACQFTGSYERRWLPGRMSNAKKGDIVLSPGGNGMIGGLLKAVDPPQRYSHAAIMTRNYYEVSHSTASNGWLEDHPNGSILGTPAPSDGFDPKVLKYLWPGGVTQTAEEGFRGSTFTAPSGKEYTLSCFGLEDTALFGDRWELIPAMVVKPHPSKDTTELRRRLHAVADQARAWCVTGLDTKSGKQSFLHYRFYAYTDAAIAVRLDPGTGRPVGSAPEEAQWPGGTLPTVCSSMVWLAARTAGNRLEGPGEIVRNEDLEVGDLAQGAQVDDQTLDGLYLYTPKERREAAEWLHPHLSNKITAKVAAGAGGVGSEFVHLFSDIADDVANQIVNTFASDWSDTDAKDSGAWRDTAEGRAVSPDDLMRYDEPGVGWLGLWGHAVPLIYRAGRFEDMPVTTWRQTSGPGTLTGLVRSQDAPAPDAQVNVGGTITHTGSDGRFRVDVPEGRYSVHATKQLPYGLCEARADVTVIFRKTVDVTINLTDPPEVFRELALDGTADGNDDEDWGDDEQFHEWIHRGPLPLGPHGTHAEFGYSKGWGGEVRANFGFQADWWPDNAITVRVDGALHEGTNENGDPEDLGGTTVASWRIPPGVTQIHELFVRNDKDDENTWCRLVLHVTNRRAP